MRISYDFDSVNSRYIDFPTLIDGFILGNYHWKGLSSSKERNIEKVSEIFLKYGEQSIGIIGVCYYEGIPPYKKDPEKARECFKKGIEDNDLISIYYQGMILCNENSGEAEEYLKRASRMGLVAATNYLGIFYANQGRYTESFEYFKEAALSGYLVSYNNIAFCYLLGDGVEQNMCEAYKWSKRGVDVNCSYSMYVMGYLLNRGIECEIDKKKALELFQTSINISNHPGSNMEMSRLYLSKGMEKEAFQCIKTAYEYPHIAAISDIVEFYRMGVGTEVDEQKAYELLKIGYNKGDLRCHVRLGIWCLNGYIVKKDHAKAFRIFEQAAQQNNEEGTYQLGKCYKYGYGCVPDYHTAIDIFQSKILRYNIGARIELSYWYISNNQFEDAYQMLLYNTKMHDINSYYEIGMLYLQRCEYKNAFEIFDKIKEKHKGAKLEYALLKYQGKGTDEDEECAFQSVKELTEQDQPDAKWIMDHSEGSDIHTSMVEFIERFRSFDTQL